MWKSFSNSLVAAIPAALADNPFVHLEPERSLQFVVVNYIVFVKKCYLTIYINLNITKPDNEHSRDEHKTNTIK